MALTGIVVAFLVLLASYPIPNLLAAHIGSYCSTPTGQGLRPTSRDKGDEDPTGTFLR